MNELSPEQLKQIDGRWKSDVDVKLHDIDARLKVLEAAIVDLVTSVKDLNEILVISKGGLSLLYLIAKVVAAIGIIAGGLYTLKKWLLE